MSLKFSQLSGKVVAVTGAARGIGLATARTFAGQGARVSIGDVDGELARQKSGELGGQGLSLGCTLDVRDRESFAEFLKATEAELGPVDVLINNAGIMPTGPFTEEPDEVSAAQIGVNLNGVILGCKLALPAMIERGQGHIVNVASMAGVLPVPGLAVYCATKFAVVGLTQSLREEFRDSGIHFSTILPAKVTTELAAGTSAAAKGVPASSPEQVAATVLKSVTHQLTEVTVPGYLGLTPALLNITPLRLQQRFRRVFGDRRILEKLNRQERQSYDRRIADLARKK